MIDISYPIGWDGGACLQSQTLGDRIRIVNSGLYGDTYFQSHTHLPTPPQTMLHISLQLLLLLFAHVKGLIKWEGVLLSPLSILLLFHLGFLTQTQKKLPQKLTRSCHLVKPISYLLSSYPVWIHFSFVGECFWFSAEMTSYLVTAAIPKSV